MKLPIETPPKTAMEVFKILPEGTRAEVIENSLYMSPSPSFNHQETLLEIATNIRSEIRKKQARIIIAPFDVFLDDDQNAVQPDIVVLLADNKGSLNEKDHFHGVPDLLVEILSPGNKDYDLVRKRALYEKFGVKEYWVIDPDSKLATGFGLNEGVYAKFAEDIGLMKSSLLASTFSF